MEMCKSVIREVKQSAEKEEFLTNVDALTDEIMQLLVAEMRYDFDFMVSRRDNRSGPEEEDQNQQVQGIKTDLFAIEKYVDEVVEEIKGKLVSITFYTL